ncbi:MAG: hypothetical protein ACTHKE_09325 [Sphingomicrobium sp.]
MRGIAGRDERPDSSPWHTAAVAAPLCEFGHGQSRLFEKPWSFVFHFLKGLSNRVRLGSANIEIDPFSILHG